MATIVASLPARFPGLRFVMVGGARELPEEVLSGLTSGADRTDKIALPSFHLIGAADKVVPPESSRLLALRFSSPNVIEHEQGHCIP